MASLTMRSVSRWWTPSCRLRRALRWRHVGPWPGGSGRVAAIRRGGMGVPRRQEAIDRPGGRRRPPNSSLWGSPRMGCRFVAFRGARFPFGCCCVRRMQNKRAPKPSFAPVRSQSELSRSAKNAEKPELHQKGDFSKMPRRVYASNGEKAPGFLSDHDRSSCPRISPQLRSVRIQS